MNDVKKQQFNDRMAALLDKYTRQLPDKYREIADAWQNFQSSPDNEDYYETFYRLVHTLKGTAATFGFVIQSESCFDIQKVLMKEKETDAAFAQESIDAIQQHLDTLKANLDAPAEDISG